MVVHEPAQTGEFSGEVQSARVDLHVLAGLDLEERGAGDAGSSSFGEGEAFSHGDV